MWIYRQSDGELMRDGAFEGNGYSGTGPGRNNHAMESVQGVGPIPCGQYTIGPAYDDVHQDGTHGLGPCVMHLDPLPGTNTFHRSEFRIHGNNSANDASHGCIILGPAIRHLIDASRDRTLTVIE